MNPRRAAISARKMVSGVTALAFVILASGCVTVPTSAPNIKDTVHQATADVSSDWNATPAVRTEFLSEPAIRSSFEQVPVTVGNRAISLDLPPGATAGDLAVMLTSFGVPTVTSADDVAARRISVPTYTGTVGGLLKIVSSMNNMSVSWHNGAILIGSGVAMTANVPPATELVKTVADDLKSLGASQIVASIPASEVSFNVPTDRQWTVERYLQRVTHNSATVGLQVAVITVGLKRDQDSGLDWSRLQMTIGRSLGLRNTGGDTGGSDLPGGNPGQSGGAGDNAGSDGGGSIGSTPLNTTSIGGVEFAGDTLGIGVSKRNFDMKALFSLLSTYGATQTTQNLVLRTLSGGKVKIRSGSTVPYVSQVSVTSAGNSNNVFGGTTTETVETGLTLTIEPRYDATTGRITMDVDLQLKSIIGFLKLSAGQQLGSLSRPEVQDQSLETIARAAAGNTVVLGGIIYDQLSDDRNTLPGLESAPVGHISRKVQRNALFVVIRPTITTYRFADSAKNGVADAQ